MKPYSARDVVDMLGISLDTFYRTRARRHDEDGLPRPISERGPLKFERTGFDAWMKRHHPLMPRYAPANDPHSIPAMSDQDHRDRLAVAYSRPSQVATLDIGRRRARG